MRETSPKKVKREALYLLHRSAWRALKHVDTESGEIEDFYLAGVLSQGDEARLDGEDQRLHARLHA